jgi:hypothetical protein
MAQPINALIGTVRNIAEDPNKAICKFTLDPGQFPSPDEPLFLVCAADKIFPAFHNKSVMCLYYGDDVQFEGTRPIGQGMLRPGKKQ